MKNNVIAHFIFDNRTGGPHSYIFEIQRSIVDFEIVIVVPGHVNYSNYELYKFRKNNFLTKFLEYLIHFFQCLFLGLRLPNVWHIHSVVNISPVLAGIILGKTCIVHVHETSPSLSAYFFFLKCLNKAFKKIILFSVVDELTLPLKIGVSSVHRGFVDTRFWKIESDELFDFKVDSNRFYRKFIMIANINPLKGIRELFLALVEFGDRIIEFRISIIGSFLVNHHDYNSSLLELRKKIESKYPNISINFLGPLDRNALLCELSSSDVYISTSKSEAFPISILEAMSMSLPVISTDVGDIRKVVNENSGNILISDMNSEEIINAIVKMSNKSPLELFGIGQKNRDIVEEKYSLDVALNELKRDYYLVSNF
jgi:glycosyltransferase involved in cell wall biosynthesis